MSHYWAALFVHVLISVVLNGCGGSDGASPSPSPAPPAPPDETCPGSGPTNCPAYCHVHKQAAGDYEFCGTIFRGIENPTHLQNFRAIQVRPDDIFFATLPPSGQAKTPGMNIISNLTSAVSISGHTEFKQFNDWENNPEPAALDTTSRRLIGIHVPFEWLPTGVLETPSGQQPCSVIYLVREPKENIVGAATFKGGESDIKPLLDAHVAAASSGGKQGGLPYGGFAAYANGYAAAMRESGRGPKVFMLSQTRLADLMQVSAEVKRLADFLEIPDYAENGQVIAQLVDHARSSSGDVGLMSQEDQRLSDETFIPPTVNATVTALYGVTEALTSLWLQ